MRRKVGIGCGVVALLALVPAVLFFVDFDSPRLGKALLDQVSAQTGLHVEAGGFRLNLLRGVRLDGVRFATDGPSGRLTVNAAGFLAQHRLPALLRGRIEIERIVVYEPRIELVTPAKTAKQAPAATKASPSKPAQNSVPAQNAGAASTGRISPVPWIYGSPCARLAMPWPWPAFRQPFSTWWTKGAG